MDFLSDALHLLDRLGGWYFGESYLATSGELFSQWVLQPGAAFLVSLFVLEFLFPQDRSSRGRYSFLNVAYLFYGLKLTIFGVWLIPWMGSSWSEHRLPTLALDEQLHPLLFMVLSLIVVGLVDYWTHRWLHTRLLWNIHKIHHAPTRINFTVLFHEHFLMSGVSIPLYTVTQLLLGATLVPPWGLFHLVVSYAQHSNVRGRLGVLNYLIATPEIHRYHHSSDPKHYNSNFSGGFMIWDMLFGTFYYDPKHPPTSFGLPGEVSTNLVRQQIDPFVWIARDTWAFVSSRARRSTDGG